MSDTAAAIIEALNHHGGWISALSLRDLLAVEHRGEGYDLALNRLLGDGRVERKCEDGVRTIYRIVLQRVAEPAPQAPQPVTTPGPQKALDAFHGQPAERVSLITTGEDEVPVPRSTKRIPKERPMAAAASTDAHTKILNLLKEHGPMRTQEVAKRAGINASTASGYLSQLAAKKKIAHEGNTRSPWKLLNGHGGHNATPAAPRAKPAKAERAGDDIRNALAVITTALKAGARRVEVKDVKKKIDTLMTLETICGKAIGRVLRAVAVDLQRMAA